MLIYNYNALSIFQLKNIIFLFKLDKTINVQFVFTFYYFYIMLNNVKIDFLKYQCSLI